MDPTANHVLVCIAVAGVREKQPYETLYIGPGMRDRCGAPAARARGAAAHLPRACRPASLKRFKGLGITAVAWNAECTRTERSTLPILVGTVDGLVYETEIERDAKYMAQVHRAVTDQVEPIHGLRFDRIRSRPEAPKYFVMLTTVNHSYQFVGPADMVETPMLGPVLAASNPNYRHNESPTPIQHSALSLFSMHPGPPEAFAWLAGFGVAYGYLDCKEPTKYHPRSGVPIETVMPGKFLLWAFAKDEPDRRPLSLVMTEFHILLLYPDRYEALCLLNQSIVASEPFPSGTTRGMSSLASDPVMEATYAVSPRTLYLIEAVDEKRDVWQLYLDQGEYAKALAHCGDNPIHADRVRSAQAEVMFENGDFEGAAQLFAQTKRSFEEVALRFLADGHTGALKTFLLHKLDELEAHEKTQLTMVCTWLVEIYLNTLNGLKDANDTEGYGALQDEFRGFLQNPKVQSNLDKPTAYDLIASHGNVEDLTFFATLIEDFERVIAHQRMGMMKSPD